MNAKSGIKVSEELRRAFREAPSSNTRFIQVVVREDVLVPAKIEKKSGGCQKDFDKIASLLSDSDPCFIIFWKDFESVRNVFVGNEPMGSSIGSRKKGNSTRVILAKYSPEMASVKEKMLLASSNASMKELVGDADDFQVTNKEDFSFSTYSQLRQRDDNLLTEVEKELRATAFADPVSLTEARQASGYNIIALGKGIKEMPKLVEESIIKAQLRKTGSNYQPVSKSDSDNNQLLRPSQVKRWPPE